MTERFLAEGIEAVVEGALNADCEAYFGYPITPQSEIAETLSRELPARGKIFVQTTSEVGSINMLYGGAATGARVMTSTSGPGWGLMQETMSHLANAELPCVIVLVQRGGPGQGTVQHSQMDYNSVTRGGGQGGYHSIVLAPWSVQELHDFVQLAFYLADKHRIPVVVLTDAVIAHLLESLDPKKIEFGPLPKKFWAVRGKGRQEDGQRRIVTCSQGSWSKVAPRNTYLGFIGELDRKYKEIAKTEVRYEAYQECDASLLLVAFGYMARVCQEVVDSARAEGMNVGLIRPMTLWPFPYDAIRKQAGRGAGFLVVEDNLGQMVDDVRLAAGPMVQVDLLGVLSRDATSMHGRILPERIMEEIKKIQGRCKA